MPWILVVLLLLPFAYASESLYKGHRVYKVMPSKPDQLEFLRQLYLSRRPKVDFWSAPRHVGRDVFVRVEPEAISGFEKELREHDIKNMIVMKDLDDEVRENLAKNELARQKHGHSVENSFTFYMTYEEMVVWLTYRVDECGERCQLINIGYTYEGRTMNVVKITDGSGREDKAGMWIDGGIHAREWIASATALYLIDKLIEEGTAVLSEFDVYVLPLVNADGYVYTQQVARLWRKNRKPNLNSTCIGTDLNRNFGFKWNSGGRVDKDPCGSSWPGDHAFSEPESANVANYLSKNLPSGGWEIFLTLHSFGNKWMSCWGYTSDLPKNFHELEHVGWRAVNATNAVHNVDFKFGNAADILYASTGTSRDWACGFLAVPYTYTLELRDWGRYGCLLPPAQIKPTGEEVWAGVREMVRAIQLEDRHS